MTHQQQQQQQQQHHHQQQSDGQKLEQCQPGEDTSICIVELDQHNNDKHNVNTERQPELKGGTFEFDMKQHMHLTKDQKYDLFREGLKRFVHEQEVKHGTVFAGPYTYKDCSCIHPGVGCLPFSLMHTIKVLPTSMSMYVPIHLVPVLIFKRKQILRQPFTVAWKFSKNVLRSALFTGFFQFGLVGSLCAFNRLFQYMGKWSVFLSGFVGGAAVFFEPFGRRLEVCCCHVICCVPLPRPAPC